MNILSAFFLTSLSMSAVIVLLLLLNRLAADRIPAKFRYGAWLIVLAGLLVPFRPDIPVPFALRRMPMVAEAADAFERVHEQTRRANHGARNDSLSDYAGKAGAELALQIAGGPPVSHSLAITGIWSVVALGLLAFRLSAYARFASLVDRWGAEAKDRRLLSILRAARDDMGFCNRKIAVKMCSLVSSPMLIGFFNPVIVLPDKKMSSDELEFIFRHELTHLKNGDLWVNLLVLLASAIHWFNPFVHLMAKAVRMDCELACDAAVIAGYGVERRANYGKAILGFAGPNKTVRPALLFLSTTFFGGGAEMKKRLFAVMDARKKSKKLAAIFVMTVAALTVIFGNVRAADAAVRGIPETPRQTQPPNPAQFQSRFATVGAPAWIDEAQAISAALSIGGLSESEAGNMNVKLHNPKKGGKPPHYRVKFFHGWIKYDIDVRADNGAFRKIKINYPGTTQHPAGRGGIDESHAKSIALSLVGVEETDVAGVQTRFKTDKKAPAHYEVKFYHGQVKYKYRIDALGGAILKAQIDML
ncbi:MAG: PepSY domain-containing protein [Planctomycetes bacterium]|nr:PepSY domain-containing protein [Planctomycetota bacterium]